MIIKDKRRLKLEVKHLRLKNKKRVWVRKQEIRLKLAPKHVKPKSKKML